jgi:hypothetical protein
MSKIDTWHAVAPGGNTTSTEEKKMILDAYRGKYYWDIKMYLNLISWVFCITLGWVARLFSVNIYWKTVMKFTAVLLLDIPVTGSQQSSHPSISFFVLVSLL